MFGSRFRNGAQGPPVDSQGNPTADPTRNVINNLQDAVKRLDDLRKLEVHRQDNLRDKDVRQLRQEMELRARYEEKLRKAESRRIDAIHKADEAAAAKVAALQTSAQANLQRQLSTRRESSQWVVATVITGLVLVLGIIAFLAAHYH
jgi:regulator of protease activity HflC (stomatin/prohibitin superfamily)